MSAYDVTERGYVHRLLFEELDHADAIFRPVDAQRRRDDVFRAQHAGPDRALTRVDFDIDFFGSSQRLRIQIAGHRN
jgi:hypothetical protein